MIKTKIVATLGPGTAESERLTALLESGVDICRLNFSHGELAQHKAALDQIRAWSAANDRVVAVLGDLGGPKIRVGQVAPPGFEIAVGQRVRIVPGDAMATAERITTTYPRFVDEVAVGQRIFIDDGTIRLLVTDRDEQGLICNCTVGGRVTSRKGINLPDSRLSTPALTEKDRRDLAWAIEHQVDYVALSFVRRPSDLEELREILDASKSDIGVIVKIEKVEALEHLDDLVGNSDGVMVARGDLGVEMDVWQVPLIQKALTGRCRETGVPIIIATQMLQSMVSSPMPTRAEVSDVANAILDAADAIMLSAETAVGEYPAAAVEIMHRVATVTEAYLAGCPPLPVRGTNGESSDPAASAVAHAAVQAARDLNARLVAVWTTSGNTVRMIARHRLPMPVIGLTSSERVCRRMNLIYGVLPIRVDPVSNPAAMARMLDERLIERELVSPGDLIIVVASTRPTTPGATDAVLLHRVGQPLFDYS